MTRLMTDAEYDGDRQLDEELADVLTAISVVSNRLAKKLRAISGRTMKGGTDDEQNERTGDGTCGT